MYTTCCAHSVCAVCIENLREDNACVCPLKQMPALKNLAPADAELIRTNFEENVSNFNEFVKFSETHLWGLRVPRDEFIKAQQKEINIVRDIVERIEQFPNMPEVPQYIFNPQMYKFTDDLDNTCCLDPRLIKYLASIGRSFKTIVINEADRKIIIETNYSDNWYNKIYYGTRITDPLKFVKEYNFEEKVQKYSKITAEDILAHPDYYWRLNELVHNTNVNINYFVNQLQKMRSVWCIQQNIEEIIDTLMQRSDMTEEIAKKLISFYPDLLNGPFSEFTFKNAHWASLEFILSHKNIVNPAALPKVTFNDYLQHKDVLQDDAHISLNPNITPQNVKEHPEIEWSIYDLAENPNFTWDDLINLFPNSDTYQLLTRYAHHVPYYEVLDIYEDIDSEIFPDLIDIFVLPARTSTSTSTK
jgi:hypothetical protein